MGFNERAGKRYKRECTPVSYKRIKKLQVYYPLTMLPL